VPSADFILQLAKAHGPLAVASAALAGNSPITDPSELKFTELEAAAIFSIGPIAQGPATTVVAGDSEPARIVRVGAISAEQITAIAPDISAP
jgi:tRNA A37 threonylcarbamoyladenosine synthetase subunit TsaC/SUA5/YrdC